VPRADESARRRFPLAATLASALPGAEEDADQIRGGRADDPCGGDEIFSPKGRGPKLGS
jgi:hypothetical protein